MLNKCKKFKLVLRGSLTILALMLLQACSDGVDVQYKDSQTQRWYSLAQVAEGKDIFIENCAVCHGRAAQATKNWRVPNEHGKYPTPPLNGTAHAWHHPLNMLIDTIENGTKGGMPAWKNKLNEEQITATIAWIESHWPEPIYQAWKKRH